MKFEYIAHVAKDKNDNWINPHFLVDHLEKTARIAGEFASKFQSRDW